MQGINKVFLIGNLGKDPEVRYTKNGTAVANISLACNKRWKAKDGQSHDKTEWIRLVLWGRLAEVSGTYLNKGDSIFVEGELQTRSWEDKSGRKNYTTEVNVSELRMLGNGEMRSYSNTLQDNRTQFKQEENIGQSEDNDVPF